MQFVQWTSRERPVDDLLEQREGYGRWQEVMYIDVKAFDNISLLCPIFISAILTYEGGSWLLCVGKKNNC